MLLEEFNVRFCETDALAHVSNTVLVDWFEMAREPIFKIFSPNLDLQNWPLILASYKVDFLDQMHYGHPVQVRTYISRIGGSSFDAYQELWQSGTKRATGTTTMVQYNYADKRSVVISDDIRAQLTEHAIPRGVNG
ncbi:acyl-CoA thioesterase [Paraglaciecola polaris]|uniref:Acyl-CoA thioester hydrolase n=1 Tax=Paraglaciecola polaris LMG 21857 TaxID=1129793 RepID=K6YQR8_9ALTE|nr:thioesterase family protein [Paraglaciecola polaris]GAC35084.1 acyl-CoA thioester hydrolase [Paraglaciecola polaris LMG 21857]|tara:strand:- start:15 stop:422 length:408 start_codon:yes stop_codon:yes gene_type:complete